MTISPSIDTWFDLDADVEQASFLLWGQQIEALATAAGRINLLINGDFQINQRVFAGGALAANTYGFDRWKAGAAGASVSLSGVVVTLTSGEIRQIIEIASWGYLSLASGVLTISVNDLTGGNLTVTAGSTSGTITAGSGQRSVTLTTAAGDTGNLTIKLAPASGAVTFKRVKVEVSPDVSPWEARSLSVEKMLCQRYYYKTYEPNVAPNTVTSSGAIGVGSGTAGSYLRLFFLFPTLMRAVPTVTFISPNGTTGKWAASSGADEPLAPLLLTGWSGGVYVEAYSSAPPDNRPLGHIVAISEI